MIRIDGSQGEGGGQILRTALALSACTGQAFLIENIRAKRKRPGLMRQHLSCVHAVQEICAATVEGDAISSQTLSFSPGPAKAGDYHFAVGSAGSAMLVLQSVLPPLLLADKPSQLILEGGTHNPLSPPFHFISEVFVPALAKIGFECSCEIERWGFYPAGGGKVLVRVKPTSIETLTRLDLCTPGRLRSSSVLAAVSKIPWEIGEDECNTIINAVNFEVTGKKTLAVESPGPGNVVMLRLDYENCPAMFTGFGELGVSRKKVAAAVYREARNFYKSEAAVDPHLADQLLLPMALAGGGCFTTTEPTDHTLTNLEVIKMFLPVSHEISQIETKLWRIDMRPAED
ncbi:MAG TPA: RNA 3'-terminal phosphate cyclase [Candidatus Riflebacteria bacterium]|jgi:RNA 3'-terminal phosphate cyclase (ATP)|nr:RNA 3'-terminal phosphate cyclase [Candidatus Riflebacteria bacterium]